jgi:hypothetical protein
MTQLRRADMMRAGPDPEIAHIRRRLIGKEDAGEQRECPRPPVRFRRCQAVDMRPTGPMAPDGDVQRDLELARRLQMKRFD